MSGRNLGLGLLVAVAALGACSRKAAVVPAEPAAPAAAAAAPAVAAAPVAPVKPVGAEAIDAALKVAQDYTAASATELAAIDAGQKRIRAAAERAVAAAGRGDTRTVNAARAEADQAHKAHTDGLAALRATAASQTSALQAALALCAASPEMTAYEGCVALTAEQATLAATIDALGKRYQAADAAYPADRARIEEASATVALGALR